MQTHRKLTVIGSVLLLITILLDNYSDSEEVFSSDFNYAYITGILMLAAFSVAFYMFTKNQLKS